MPSGPVPGGTAALGAWNDFDALLDEIERERLYETHISGEYAAARAHWAERGQPGGTWVSYGVRAPLADVEAALKEIGRAHV